MATPAGMVSFLFCPGMCRIRGHTVRHRKSASTVSQYHTAGLENLEGAGECAKHTGSSSIRNISTVVDYMYGVRLMYSGTNPRS